MKRIIHFNSIAVSAVLLGMLVMPAPFPATSPVEANSAAPLLQEQFPPDMPDTPFPDIKGCSSSQEAHLRKAWRLAHYFTWRADKLVDYVMSQDAARRAELWNADYIEGDTIVPSLRRWFGPYNSARAQRVREAIDKARKRFENKGEIVKGIRTLRCGQPIAPKPDQHTDVCPGSNIGGNGPPGGYHAPVGVIVTCPPFWERANIQSETNLALSARMLVHEIFHWLSVDGKYVTDFHGGLLPQNKYYGEDKSRYLAENKPDWAIYNNDNYESFIYYVGTHEPSFSGVWGEKETGGTGGFFADLSWEQLVSWWKKLGDSQYLSDIETYVRDGKRKFMGLWRVGKGNGALLGLPWSEFDNQYKQLRKTQDLIDIEIYKSGDAWMYLGVYRVKQGDATGDGGLLVGLTWEELVSKWKQFANVAYLSDVEAYVDGGKQKFIGVWRAGKGNGALYLHLSGSDLDQAVAELRKSQELIDFEKFIAPSGKWNYLTVWRTGKKSSSLDHRMTVEELFKEWDKQKSGKTMIDVEEYSALPARFN